MQERLAKLAGGVAVLYIGAGSEVELKEKKDRVDDALQATKAAIEEGVVEGGGIALLRTLKALENVETNDVWETDGVDVIAYALSAPITQILLNAGQSPEDIISALRTHWIVDGGENLGYNARTEEFVDMFADGVIDPKKVTRTAIQNAASVVGMILTTECMVVDKPEETDKPKQPQMLMG
jgi:chaperonin GroEL